MKIRPCCKEKHIFPHYVFGFVLSLTALHPFIKFGSVTDTLQSLRERSP